MVYGGTDGYEMQQVVKTRWHNRRQRVSNDDLMLGEPNKKQSNVRNNTYTQSKDVGTFNIRYVMVGLVVV